KNGALLFSADPAQFTISLNGEPAFEKTGSGLIFSNGKTIAGGLPISPASEPDDKQLELKILEGEGWGEQMMSAVLVLLGGDQEGRSYQNIGSATIESSQPAEVSIDGEVCRKLPVSIRYYKTIEIVAS